MAEFSSIDLSEMICSDPQEPRKMFLKDDMTPTPIEKLNIILVVSSEFTLAEDFSMEIEVTN